MTYKLNAATNTKDLRNISRRTHNPQTEWTFENYLKKYEPSVVWERIDKMRKYKGLNITYEEQTEMMIEGIDTFNEMMDMKIENGDPKLILKRDGRRGWVAPGAASENKNDRFYLRRRLYELMKQAIYQTRNKMIGMQMRREALANSSLYKMGFLMNKIDNLVKVFSMFSYRALKGCTQHLVDLIVRFPTYDILNANERQLSILFNIELLFELLRRNDVTCKRLFKKVKVNRKEKLDAMFEN
ncbi:hypothetical protein HW555_010160 [Spodoptera exigua]|uniref:Uncharacterized protein n=1 Tax=Spodoptera exigua TaxID=7107 RepID=A0A835L166_SPOEX|nr:hypothetical protein HW555_010160 [Spodoptera exigua]